MPPFLSSWFILWSVGIHHVLAVFLQGCLRPPCFLMSLPIIFLATATCSFLCLKEEEPSTDTDYFEPALAGMNWVAGTWGRGKEAF